MGKDFLCYVLHLYTTAEHYAGLLQALELLEKSWNLKCHFKGT